MGRNLYYEGMELDLLTVDHKSAEDFFNPKANVKGKRLFRNGVSVSNKSSPINQYGDYH